MSTTGDEEDDEDEEEEEDEDDEEEEVDKELEKTCSNHIEQSAQCSSKKKSVRWTESTTFHEVKEREDDDEDGRGEEHQQLLINKVNARHSMSSFVDVDLVPYYDKRESLDYETVAKTLANKLGVPELATLKPGLLTPGASVDELRFQLPVNDELEQLIESLKAYRRTVAKKERVLKPDLPSAFQHDDDGDGDEIDTSLNEDIFHELIFDRPTTKLPPKKEQHELELDDAFAMLDAHDDVWRVICSAPGRVRIQSYDGHRLVLRYLWSTVEVHVRFGPLMEDGSGERSVKRVDLFRMVSPDTHMADIRLRLAGVEDRPLLDYDPLPWPFQVDDEVPILVAAASPIHYDFQLQVGGKNCVRSSMPSPVANVDQLLELLWSLNDAAKVGRELAYQLLLIRSAEYCRFSIDQQGMLA